MKLKGHRLEQLQLLIEKGAIGQQSALPVSFTPGLRHVTLSRMAEEGLVAGAYLPLNGDKKRRVSHVWATTEGMAAWEKSRPITEQEVPF